jgi:hypothetical protein
MPNVTTTSKKMYVFSAMLRHTTQCYQACKVYISKDYQFNVNSYAKTVKLVHKIAILLYSEFNGTTISISTWKRKINFKVNQHKF